MRQRASCETKKKKKKKKSKENITLVGKRTEPAQLRFDVIWQMNQYKVSSFPSWVDLAFLATPAFADHLVAFESLMMLVSDLLLYGLFKQRRPVGLLRRKAVENERIAILTEGKKLKDERPGAIRCFVARRSILKSVNAARA